MHGHFVTDVLNAWSPGVCALPDPSTTGLRCPGSFAFSDALPPPLCSSAIMPRLVLAEEASPHEVIPLTQKGKRSSCISGLWATDEDEVIFPKCLGTFASAWQLESKCLFFLWKCSQETAEAGPILSLSQPGTGSSLTGIWGHFRGPDCPWQAWDVMLTSVNEGPHQGL